MKTASIVCWLLVLALPISTCTPEASPSISVTEGSLSLHVAEVDGGVKIQNQSDIDCIVYVRSPEGEQMFELGAGESITVTGMTAPIGLETVIP